MKICVCETVEELGEKTFKAFNIDGCSLCFTKTYAHALEVRRKIRLENGRAWDRRVIIFTVDPEAKKRLMIRDRWLLFIWLSIIVFLSMTLAIFLEVFMNVDIGKIIDIL